MANDLMLARLRSAYDDAFAALAREVRSCGANVQAAEYVYRARRNALAAYLIHREVQRRAYRLWEQSGRPHGSADWDWALAEHQLPGGGRLLRAVA